MLHSVMPMAKLLFKHPTDQTLKKITELCVAQSLFFFSGCWPRASARGNRSHGNRGPIKASRCSSTLEGWLSRADSSSLWRHSAAVIEKLASGGWSIGAQFKYLYSGNDRKLKRAHRDQKYTWKKIGLFIRARTKAGKCFFQLGKTK